MFGFIPILVKCLVDEFGYGFKHVSTPAPASRCLQAGNDEDIISEREKKRYQAGVGKLLYLIQWLRPEVFMQFSRALFSLPSLHQIILMPFPKFFRFCTS
jgi:hypothetical protein